jgi:hypothetical protein
MVLSRAKEEGAGTKEKRSKGEDNRGTPTPYCEKISPFERGLQVIYNITNVLTSQPMYLSVNTNPQKPPLFGQ